MSKINKVGNTFVFINDDGIKMGTINIETEKFVGATICHMVLYEHTQNFKKTNLEFINEQLKKKEKFLNHSRDTYFVCLKEFEELENLKKELEEKCNVEKTKIV